MYKTILKIENATENLAMVGYNWVGESYEHRLEKIMNQIKDKTGGYPSANMQPIRKMTISVSDRTNELMIVPNWVGIIMLVGMRFLNN